MQYMYLFEGMYYLNIYFDDEIIEVKNLYQYAIMEINNAEFSFNLSWKS